MADFADLIAPMDPATFFSEYYGKKPVHIQRGGGAGAAILTWSRLNEILALHPYWTEPHLRLMMGSKPALTQHYCDEVETLNGKVMRANPAKVKAFLGMGASLVANRVHAVSPEIRAVARVLEEKFTASVGANVYCSFQNVQAFKTHFDLHEVFAVQTEGEKVWNVYEARADNPVSPLPPGEETERLLINTRGKLLFQAHMKPGDLIYLPRGQYHDALASSDASLHVTFNVLPKTGLGLFGLLEEEASLDSLFRAYLPDAREDGAALEERLKTLAGRLGRIMASPAFRTEVLNAQRALKTPAVDYGLPDVTPPAFYAVTARGQVSRTADGHVLTAGQTQIPLGPAHAAVRWMMQQNHFSLEDALARHPYLQRDEFTVLLDKLSGAGVIARTEPASLRAAQ